MSAEIPYVPRGGDDRKERFLKALHGCLKAKVRFRPKRGGRTLERTCAPMDYGRRHRSRSTKSVYHLWDYDSAGEPHPLFLEPAQIFSIEVLTDEFDPAEFVKLPTDWREARDWGKYS